MVVQCHLPFFFFFLATRSQKEVRAQKASLHQGYLLKQIMEMDLNPRLPNYFIS